MCEREREKCTWAMELETTTFLNFERGLRIKEKESEKEEEK